MIVFRCHVHFEIETSTGKHHRTTEFKFSKKGVAYERAWRADKPGWVRIGYWSWDALHHQVVVQSVRKDDSGAPEIVTATHDAWDEAYINHVQGNLLS